MISFQWITLSFLLVSSALFAYLIPRSTKDLWDCFALRNIRDKAYGNGPFCAAGFSATAHSLHVLRASYPALFQVIPGGTSVGARGCIGRKRNSAIRTFAGQRIVRFVGRERSRFILHPAPFFQLFFQKKTGGPFSADVVGEISFGFGHGSDSSCVSLCHDMFLEQITNKRKIVQKEFFQT